MVVIQCLLLTGTEVIILIWVMGGGAAYHIWFKMSWQGPPAVVVANAHPTLLGGVILWFNQLVDGVPGGRECVLKL